MLALTARPSRLLAVAIFANGLRVVDIVVSPVVIGVVHVPRVGTKKLGAADKSKVTYIALTSENFLDLRDSM